MSGSLKPRVSFGRSVFPRTSWGPRTFAGGPRNGHFTVLRQTMRQRQQAKLRALKEERRRRMHTPIAEQGAYLRAVLAGHFRYYGVPLNGPALNSFRGVVGRLWWRILRRRGQKHHLPWRHMRRYTSSAGFPRFVFVIPIRYSAWALSPKGGAGRVSSARPDLRRGSRAIAIPTPTGPQALKRHGRRKKRSSVTLRPASSRLFL
jgi:hypothetical protein